MKKLSGLNELVEYADKGGEITLEQILGVVPDAAEDSALLAEIMEHLDAEDVQFVVTEDDEEDLAEIDLPLLNENLPVNDIVGRYMAEMNKHPLLTAVDEVRLAKSIEAGKVAAQRLNEAGLPESEREVLQLAIERSELARNSLVQANTRLVISIAKRYFGQGLDFLDLIQEGNIGLLTAVDKFDYRLGNRFSTYATWWIRQGITRALVNHGRMIRIPAHQATTMRQLYRFTRDWEQNHGRNPTLEEIAKGIDQTPERVRWLQQLARPLLALEQPAGDESDAELGDFIEDSDASQPADIVANKMFSEKLHEILDTLSPRESSVLRLRYGLQGNSPLTLKEVGKLFNLSRERIRQVEMGALRKLRHLNFAGETPYYVN